MKTVDMEFVKTHSNGHFFVPAAMRGFRSHLAQLAYVTDDDKTAYFVTSEQFVSSNGKADPRVYTVRVMDMETGDVRTTGKRGAYNNVRTANHEAKRLADVVVGNRSFDGN